MDFYRFIFRTFFSKFDPERVHHFVAFLLRVGSATRVSRILRPNPKYIQKFDAFGLSFSGPFGMAAGFDKNATMILPLFDLGFSHVEIGTVTALAQPGNPKPRLFRLVEDRALINRMGFNNDGAEVVAKRLEKLRSSNKSLPVIGVNIGKSKVTELQDAVSDYRTSTKLLAPLADYLVINVSSPNTPGLRSLQQVSELEPIVAEVLKFALGKPVLVKIAPDLADEDIIEIAKMAIRLGANGLIATNTTISRRGLKTTQDRIDEIGAGGLSGEPLKDRSEEVLKLIRSEIGDDLSIISVGGVQTKQDVEKRLAAGADLVQGYTEFIYAGPFWARQINTKFKQSKA